MNKSDIVKKLLSAIEKCNYDEAKNYLTDDFTFNGPVPKPIGSDEWLDVHKKISKGLPDFCYNVKNLNESGNTVNGSVEISGTHSKELPTLIPGVDPIPATNKKVQLPEEDFTVTFKGDKISKFTVEKVATGGILGLLKQVGVRAPSFLG